MSSQSSDEFPIITFNSLYNILREEEKSSTLHTLPHQFYPAVEAFLQEKYSEASTQNATQKQKNLYSNAHKVFSKLQSLRAKKIAILAIDTLNSSQNEEKNLTSVEKEFKTKIISAYNSTYSNTKE